MQLANAPVIKDQYRPYGHIRDLFRFKGAECMLEGPAGTGKSRGNLEYLNYWAMSVPGCRLLMVRKTRRSLSESGMITLEQKVLHPAQGVRFHGSKQQYQYPNGSIIAVGGLDKSSKIMSSEWDIIYAQEATELDEEDWEACSIRLRNGRLPIQQLIGDCNPGPSSHWIKQREQAGRLLCLPTRHEDNPALFNRDGTMTPDGERYLARLDQLTGVRYARYRLGLWVSAEGMVYEDSWDPKRNIINHFYPPKDWPRYLAVDFGFVHPFVCLWAAIDPDGNIYIYRQIYKTKTLVEDHAKMIKEISRWGEANGDPLPRAIICDHDAEDRRTLERHLGLGTLPANKNVSGGIQAVASRFRDSGNGRPRLMIMRGSLAHNRDQDQADNKLPTCVEEEPESYVWDTSMGARKGEKPVKENDDGCFVAGTLVTTDHGDIPIEQVKIGDRVLTRDGYMLVKASGMTNQHAETFTVQFSNGTTLTGTANHPVYLKDKGYTPLHALRYGDIIMDINSSKERYPLLWQSLQQKQKSLFTKGSSSDVIQMQRTGRDKITIDQEYKTFNPVLRRFIRRFGKMRMGQFQKGAIFTTKMATHQIMLSKIWNASLQKNMQTIMLNSLFQKSDWKNYANEQRMQGLPRVSGINQMLVGNGIANLGIYHGRKLNITPLPVSNAVQSIKQGTTEVTLRDIVQTIASQQHVASQEPIISQRIAQFAGRNLPTTGTTKSLIHAQKNVELECDSLTLFKKQEYAQCVKDLSQQERVASRSTAQEHAQAVVVCSISKNDTLEPVYNITVDNTVGEGEYFANGILVHNCDALRYLVAHFDLKPPPVKYSARMF